MIKTIKNSLATIIMVVVWTIAVIVGMYDYGADVIGMMWVFGLTIPLLAGVAIDTARYDSK